MLVASYLPSSSRAHLQSLLANQSDPCPERRSDAVQVQPLSFRLTTNSAGDGGAAAAGATLRLRLLAFARDELVQTALVSVAPEEDSALTQRSHLAMAISTATEGGEWTFDDEYAEALWMRLDKAAMLQLHRDASNPNRIVSVRLTPPTDDPATHAENITSFATLMPPIMGFDATPVAVRLIDSVADSLPQDLRALVCTSTGYDASTHTCLAARPSANEPWRAFFSALDAAALRRALVADVCGVPGWDVTAIADHSTIEYIADPAARDPGVYNKSLGAIQRFMLRAYARDEHSSSALVSLEEERDGATGQPSGPTHSRNSHPHITLTSMEDVAEGVYGPAYSNILWKRLEHAALVLVERDDEGRIRRASLANGGRELRARLPPFAGDARAPWGHAATQVYVRIMGDRAEEGFEGVVCTSVHWDALQRKCVWPRVPARPGPGAGNEDGDWAEVWDRVEPSRPISDPVPPPHFPFLSSEPAPLRDVDDGVRGGGGLGEGGRVGLGIGCGVAFTLALVLCCMWCRGRAHTSEAERALADQLEHSSGTDASVSFGGVGGAGAGASGSHTPSTPGTPRRSQHKRMPSRLPYLPPTLRLGNWDHGRSLN